MVCWRQCTLISRIKLWCEFVICMGKDEVYTFFLWVTDMILISLNSWVNKTSATGQQNPHQLTQEPWRSVKVILWCAWCHLLKLLCHFFLRWCLNHDIDNIGPLYPYDSDILLMSHNSVTVFQWQYMVFTSEEFPNQLSRNGDFSLARRVDSFVGLWLFLWAYIAEEFMLITHKILLDWNWEFEKKPPESQGLCCTMWQNIHVIV
jgi:hypothetical protein